MNEFERGQQVRITQPPGQWDTRDHRGKVATVLFWEYGKYAVTYFENGVQRVCFIPSVYLEAMDNG